MLLVDKCRCRDAMCRISATVTVVCAGTPFSIRQSTGRKGV